MSSLLKRLRDHGDKVDVRHGRLVITPGSDKPVPIAWLDSHRHLLFEEIAAACKLDILIYDGYTTGNFESRYPGAALQFTSLLNGQDYYSIFNVGLIRQRTSKHGAKGTPLPGKQFHCGKRSNLWKLWIALDLQHPRQASELHTKLSQLKQIAFLTDDHQGRRIQNDDLQALDLECQAIFTPNSEPVSNPFTCRDDVVNKSLKRDVKEFKQGPINTGFQGFQTTGLNNHGASQQGSAGKGISSMPKDPQDQTSQEWLEDYNREPIEMKQ